MELKEAIKLLKEGVVNSVGNERTGMAESPKEYAQAIATALKVLDMPEEEVVFYGTRTCGKTYKRTYEWGLIVGTKREREYWEKKIKDKLKEVTKLYNEIYEFPEPKVEETPEGQLIYQIRYNTDKEALRIVRVIINQLLEEE